MKPRFSVVTPLLNSAPFLPTLLRCIDAQTYPDLEHILVDGGSKDGSVEMLQKADAQRRRWVQRQDRSMYEAINFGIGQAQGEVIACLNADDLYFPDTAEYVMRFFDAHPGVDIAYGDHLSLLTNHGSFDLNYIPREYTDAWGDVLVYLSQPAVFVRRNVFDRVGLFDDTLRAAADFDYWHRAFLAGVRFKKFDRIVSIVTMHGANLSLSPQWQQEYEVVKRRHLSLSARAERAETVRLAKRRLKLNRLTVPWMLRRAPRPAVRFSAWRYFRYLASRRPQAEPIFSIDLPYLQYAAHRVFNYADR
jgi:glycosyltransferase involved in cell wall biosynthesis